MKVRASVIAPSVTHFFTRIKMWAILGNGGIRPPRTERIASVGQFRCCLYQWHGSQCRVPRHVDVIATSIKEVTGEDKVGQIVFKDDQKINIDGVSLPLDQQRLWYRAEKLGAVVGRQ